MTHDSGFAAQIRPADAAGERLAVPAATALTAVRRCDHGLGERIVIITAMALFIAVQIVVGSIVWAGLGMAWLLGRRG